MSTKEILNLHLDIVFQKVLPEIQRAGINSWVYGGVGYAAPLCYFYRENSDVDIFVNHDDFDKTEGIVRSIAQSNHWNICIDYIVANRPKIELLISRKERLSIVPIFISNNQVEFRFRDGRKYYSLDALRMVPRRIRMHSFFTPPDTILKQLFIDFLHCKGIPKHKPKRIEDGRRLLSKEEFAQYWPDENYEANI